MQRRPPEWTDTAPVKMSATREMAASAQEVWDAICDHDQWTEWFPRLEACRPTGGTGIGSTRTVQVGGKEVHEEFIVWDEPTAWGFTVVEADGPLGRITNSLNERISIDAVSNDRARVTYLMAWDPKTWSAPILKLANRPVSKILDQALTGLEQHVRTQRDHS